MWFFVLKPLFVDGIFTLSSRTLRCFSRGPSPLCSSIRLVRTLLLNFKFLVLLLGSSKFYYKDTAFPNSWTPIWRNQTLARHVFCLSQHIRGKKFPNSSAVKQSVQSFDRSCSHSAFISGRIQSSSFFSARARYTE